ncbi:LOW QUALITY PROTEIN: NXPE family member 3-like [Acanthaster planci]|uniref:LOW QUALITY PROTEIN: NXPE family member 3-like n=1 Tax=Acanthaster planci TaxID=133434 RepID=A0A8B7ZAN0_ACAPL|nr:LOW QUALITY PROTEIN: NXPE family member 3-like [Acanthaster planci]
MAASSPGHQGDRLAGHQGNKLAIRSGKVKSARLGPRVSKSLLWCFGVFFMVGVGIDVAYYWQGDHVETRQSQQRPVPRYAVRHSTGKHQFSSLVSGHNASEWSSPISGLSTEPNVNISIFEPSSIDVSSTFSKFKVLQSSFPTDGLNSFFTIKNARQALNYSLCDTLELHIEARDQHNQLKQYGGDYFWAKIFSITSHSSQPADEIMDHGNGTYTARFALHWTGAVSMQVLLIKSSEYVALLRELREAAPARFAYNGKFQVGDQIEVMPCHITTEMFLGFMEAERSRGFCDFSNRRLGFPWFCLKPHRLPCSSFVEHMGSLSRSHAYNELLLQDKPISVIHPFAVIKQIGATAIEVTSVRNREGMSLCMDKPLPLCTPGLPPRPPKSVAGFYHQTSWQSLICQVRNFQTSDALKCLQDHSLFFYGDSTLRQWFEYLSLRLGPTMMEQSCTSKLVGPRFVHDVVHNISMTFRIHGYPIRSIWLRVKDIAYTANEIDALPGGPDTVVVLTLWAHFTPTSLQFYRDRWRAIKAALQRLQMRAPGALVVIKSANTREQQGIDMSNWYAMELDKVMREELALEQGVAIIDVWDMTLSHSTGYNIHPSESIVAQEMKMFLSFLCPVP